MNFETDEPVINSGNYMSLVIRKFDNLIVVQVGDVIQAKKLNGDDVSVIVKYIKFDCFLVEIIKEGE